jgi:hypothetical protein
VRRGAAHSNTVRHPSGVVVPKASGHPPCRGHPVRVLVSVGVSSVHPSRVRRPVPVQRPPSGPPVRCPVSGVRRPVFGWQVASPPSRHCRRARWVRPTATRFGVPSGVVVPGCPDAHRALFAALSASSVSVCVSRVCPVRCPPIQCPASGAYIQRPLVRCPVSACPVSGVRLSSVRCPPVQCPVRASGICASGSVSTFSVPVSSWSAAVGRRPHGWDGPGVGVVTCRLNDWLVICPSRSLVLGAGTGPASQRRRRLGLSRRQGKGKWLAVGRSTGGGRPG